MRARPAFAALLALAFAGCGRVTGASPASVTLSYARGLGPVVRQALVPSFKEATGYQVTSAPAGGADVVIAPLASGHRGPRGAWYATFARAPLLLAYDPSSPFAPALRSQPWYEVAGEPGFRLGRVRRAAGPEGALSLDALHLALVRNPSLRGSLLARTPSVVASQDDLVAMLGAHELDAAFMFSDEAAAAHLPVVPLDLSLPPAVFTVTIPRGVQDLRAASAFVRFLLGSRARPLLQSYDLSAVAPRVYGRPPGGVGTVPSRHHR